MVTILPTYILMISNGICVHLTVNLIGVVFTLPIVIISFDCSAKACAGRNKKSLISGYL